MEMIIAFLVTAIAGVIVYEQYQMQKEKYNRKKYNRKK